MPKKKPKKKPNKFSPPSIHTRFDEIVRKSSSLADLLERVGAEALAMIADPAVIQSLPIPTRKRLAKDLAEIAINLHFEGLKAPRVTVKQGARAMEAAEVFTAGIQRLAEPAQALPASVRVEMAKAALKGALQMMGVDVQTSAAGAR